MSRLFDDVLVGSIELFCLAAEQGGFTQAAAMAGVTPAAVSRSVARLESRLGIRLFTRTTRRIVLTQAGELYFQQCREALAQLVEAEREVTGQQEVVSGKIRISMPTSYGHARLLPLLPQFLAIYPLVEIEAHISNHSINFYDDGFDLAIRARAPKDSTLIARPLESSPLIVVATPDYLQRAGTPQTLGDLTQFNCIQFVLPRSGRLVPWSFNDQEQDVDVETRGNICCSDDILGPLTLARNGAGLIQVNRFLVEKDLRRGTLVEVLTPYRGRTRTFTLLYPHSRHLSLRVRVFVDFLLSHTAEKGESSAKRKASPSSS